MSCKTDDVLETEVYLVLDNWGTLEIRSRGTIHKSILDELREEGNVVGPISREDLWDFIEDHERDYTDTMSNKEKVADSVERTLRPSCMESMRGSGYDVTVAKMVWNVKKDYPEIGLKDSSIQVYVYDILNRLVDNDKVMRHKDGTYVPTRGL